MEEREHNPKAGRYRRDIRAGPGSVHTGLGSKDAWPVGLNTLSAREGRAAEFGSLLPGCHI